jgi:hypothetical protein
MAGKTNPLVAAAFVTVADDNRVFACGRNPPGSASGTGGNPSVVKTTLPWLSYRFPFCTFHVMMPSCQERNIRTAGESHLEIG